MLFLQANSLREAYCQTLQRLYRHSSSHDDPEIFREDVGVIEIHPTRAFGLRDPFDDLFQEVVGGPILGSGEDPPFDPFDAFPPVKISLESLDDSFPYHEHFPRISDDIVGRELTYWNQQLFTQKKLPELIEYLKQNPLSKRAIILLWEDKYRDLSKGAVCEIALVFRLKDGALEMHTHMRANNASFLLFMDMRILMGVQSFVAAQLGVEVGSYIHFIDSLHIYEAERYHAIQQLKFISLSPLWDTF